MDFIVSEGDKVKLIKKLLNDNECVMVFLNTSNKNLVIPSYLKDSSTVTLQISLHFQGNIFLLKDGIKVDLIFSTDYETCFLPWSAIWGAKGETEKDTNFWLESMPNELKKQILTLNPKEKDLISADKNDEELSCDSHMKKSGILEVKDTKTSSETNSSKEKTIKKATKYPNFSVIK